MKSSSNLGLLLIKPQTTWGTMESPLVGTDVVETIGPAKITENPIMNPIELVAGEASQDLSVFGGMEQDLSFNVPVKAKGANDMGQLGKLLKLSGMKEAVATGVYTYTFTSKQSEMKDGTAWFYSGVLDTGEATRQVGFNLVFSPKFTLESGKYATLELNTKMCFAPWAAATQPSITKESTVPPCFVGATTLSIMGSSNYKVISFSIDPQQEIKLTKDPSQAYGFNVSALTNRKVAWTAKVYRENLSTENPLTSLTTNAKATTTIEFGTAPQKVKFLLTDSQITKIDKDDEDVVDTYTLSGLVDKNQFSLVYTTV